MIAAPPMALDISSVTVDSITALAPLPDDGTSVFLSESIVEGWAHANSDLDVYVVSRDLPDDLPRTYSFHVRLKPDTIVQLTAYSDDDERLDIQYWLDDQVLAEIGAGGRRRGLVHHETDFLWRLSQPIVGGTWLNERKEEPRASLFRRVLATNVFEAADGLIDDALGQLAAGDRDSAILAARTVFGHVVDGLLAHDGELALPTKWRARRLARARPPGARVRRVLADRDDGRPRRRPGWLGRVGFRALPAHPRRGRAVSETANAYPERALDVHVRSVGGVQHIARPREIYELSDVATVVWKLSDCNASIDDIAAKIADQYDVSLDVARADVRGVRLRVARPRLRPRRPPGRS